MVKPILDPRLMFALKVKGLVKIQKSEKNSDCSDSVRPPSYPFFCRFKIWKNENNTTKHRRNTKFKKKSVLGLDPPTHFRVFLGFSDYHEYILLSVGK